MDEMEVVGGSDGFREDRKGQSLLSKTKRLDESGEGDGESDSSRRARNDMTDRIWLGDVYDEFYEEGFLREADAPARLSDVYGLLGRGDTTYFDEPLSEVEFQRFVGPVAGRMLTTQRNGTNVDRAFEKGDYFHVTNVRYRAKDTHNIARRLVVNVATQEAGLRVAEGLQTMFGDPGVRDHFMKFKVYLRGTLNVTQGLAREKDGVKHDKLVVYYNLDTSSDGADTVGDALVSNIRDSIRSGEARNTFAPFYSQVAPGVAWSEEPKMFVPTLEGSFTQTRAGMIDDVMEDFKQRGVSVDKPTFIDAVYARLVSRGVQPGRSHRHVPAFVLP
ncbi:T3SS effector HopA1 family protein [Acrocarpospora corrugata]|nr:T3SS effector HopA1 family protein [Acrocarpospora corrugata]